MWSGRARPEQHQAPRGPIESGVSAGEGSLSIRARLEDGEAPIGKPPITSMPHWGGIIPDDQLRALVSYITTLK